MNDERADNIGEISLFVKKDFSTNRPKKWVTPVDKVSNLAFDGNGTLYSEKLIGIKINTRGAKKHILSMVSLDPGDQSVKIIGKKELTPYDREVHDAIVTLYVEGKNDFFTPQMIYRTMTGNPSARLPAKQQLSISNSLNKLMFSIVRIESSKEECEAYGFDRFFYEGAVIQWEKCVATIKGTVLEVYHLLRQPVLYTYAGKKNQIGKFDIKLLNSPVNKNEENITLQSYLYRRILSVKSNTKLSSTIIYDSIYKKLGVKSTSVGALRKKKLKVRKTTKQILNYWVDLNFIQSFSENKCKDEIISITVNF